MWNLLRSRVQSKDQERSAEEQEAFERAKRFEHYWYNAQKKIDLKRIEGFGALAERVHLEGRTYLHLDRLYTLWQAIVSMPATARAVVEIGVFQGGSSKFIAEALTLRGRPLPLYACDTFAGHAVVDQSVDGRHQVGKQFVGVKLDKLRTYLASLESIQIVQGDIRETATLFELQHDFGLVHIDVDVYPITKFCLDFFAPRVVAGGTIVVDDYGFKTTPGAKVAVDEFVAGSSQYRMLHLLTGQAVLIRLAS